MYIIVIGAGRTGGTVIERATRENHEVVVVERDPEVAEEVSTTYDCLVINADATSTEILVEAGIESADAIIATTENDSVNLMVSMLGRDFGVETIVSSINDPEHIDLFEDLGVNVVESPHRLNGRYLYRTVKRPAISDFMQIADGAEIFEVTVEAGAPIAGLRLSDADTDDLLPDETVLVAIVRGGDLLVPRGDSEIRAGDRVTVFAMNGATEHVTAAFTEPDNVPKQ